MLYLIDGYNLLFYLLDSKHSLESQRDSIIRSIQQEFSLLHLKGQLIFDGSHSHGEGSGRSYKSPLVIVYSHKDQTADQFILEQLEASSATSEITVVTNDKKLASAARGFKARTLSVQAFVAEIERKHAKKQRRHSESKAERPIVESPKQLERLKKLFEERLLDDEDDL